MIVRPNTFPREKKNAKNEQTTNKKKPSLVLSLDLKLVIGAGYMKQEDLLDLITALLKFNCSLSNTVVAQCRLQSSP